MDGEGVGARERDRKAYGGIGGERELSFVGERWVCETERLCVGK